MKGLFIFAVFLSLFSATGMAEETFHAASGKRYGDVDGIDQLNYTVNSLRNRVDDLNRNGARDEYELQNIKNDLLQANQSVGSAIRGLQIVQREVRYQVNQSMGPYAPSCNGNPVYPQPDSRCCGFGQQALCFTYTVGCGTGETFVRAEVSCQGYVGSSYALEVGNLGSQARQMACEKRDGGQGYVNLVGAVVCRRR